MISKKTKYGLKALSYLAKQETRKPVLISEIAQTQNISQKFLESILLELKKKGFVGEKGFKLNDKFYCEHEKKFYKNLK